MAFCTNHDHLYFDKLCRTKKAESVLSLIHATYQTKINNGSKAELAKKLENAYELFKFDSGSYSGAIKQFESQYTIGHELGIWKNSDLELTDLAIQVAENRITIKEYFDIYFLNYIQPIDGKVYNILYLITEYMIKNKITNIEKKGLADVFSFASASENNEINGLYNMLLGTSYFEKGDRGSLECKYIIKDINRCCSVYAHNKEYNDVKAEFQYLDKYLHYLLTDNRTIEITNSYRMINLLEDNKNNGLEHLIDLSDNKKFANECFNFLEESGLLTEEIIGKLCDVDYCNKNIPTYSKKYAVLKKIDTTLSVEEQIKDNGNPRYYPELREYYGEKYAIMNNWYKDKQGLNNWTTFVGWIRKLLETKNAVLEETDFNKIYYGIPGCGKSYYIEHTVLNGVDKDNIVRTTFYLDYTNSDFIGQIYPIVDNNGHVKYERVPGPFTRALEKAYRNPKKTIYLVIEEINRGNAAAIFGDIFQLLDRIVDLTDEQKKDGRNIGDSEYPINNEFIDGYFANVHRDALSGTELSFNYIKGQKIIIPNNLKILATMNTSDQNVFPLDTAFKRRWDMERVTVDWDKVNAEFKNMYVPFTNFTWEIFATSVNKKMIENDSNGLIMEDKQLGPYFANKSMLVSKEEKAIKNTINKNKLNKFVNNVIDYLYHDATKFEHTILFEENLTYDDIYEKINGYYYSSNLDDNNLCMVDFDSLDIKTQVEYQQEEGYDEGND